MAGDLDAGFRGLAEGLVAAGRLTEPVAGEVPGEVIAPGGPPPETDADAPMRVLVVDDRPELRESLQALLDGDSAESLIRGADIARYHISARPAPRSPPGGPRGIPDWPCR